MLFCSKKATSAALVVLGLECLLGPSIVNPPHLGGIVDTSTTNLTDVAAASDDDIELVGVHDNGTKNGENNDGNDFSGVYSSYQPNIVQ